MHRILHLGDRRVNLDTGLIYTPNVTTSLRPKDLELLRFLASRTGRVVSRDDLLVQVWGYHPSALTRTVDIAMSRLRKRIEPDPANPRFLITIHGMGYRLEGEEAPDVGLVGRDAEVRAILAWADAPGPQCLSLVGLGGIGKSRLARYAFGKLGESRRVRWVGPADCAILDRIFITLGAPPDGPTPEQRLALVLGDAPMLLVIDEVEAASLDPLRAVLVARPATRVLLTSRIVPNLPGDVLQIGGLDDHSARSLLTRGTDIADDADLRALMSRCQGVPLVLELAAAALERRPPSAVASLLAWDVASLADNDRAGPTHHRSVRACLDRSLALLGNVHRDALVKLSVFRSPFDERRAAAVAGIPAEVISSLLTHSLIEASNDGLALHPLVRAVAVEQPEAQELSEAHRRWFLGYLAEQGGRIETPYREKAVADLRAADADVRAALAASIGDIDALNACRDAIRAWALTLGQAGTVARQLEPVAESSPGLALLRSLLLTGEDARRALGAVDVSALSRFDRVRCFTSRAVAEARAGDGSAAARWVAEGLAIAVTPEERLLAHSADATAAWRLGRPAEAVAPAEMSLAYAREVRDPAALTAAFERLAVIHYERGAHALSKAAYAQSLALAEQNRDRMAIANARNGLGNLARRDSRLDDAREQYSLCIATLEQLGVVASVAVVRFNLSLVLRDSGDLDEAERWNQAALDLASRANLLHQVLDCLSGLGNIEMIRGRPKQARSWFEAALAQGQASGAPETMLWRARWNLGVAAWRTGDLDGAAREFEFLRQQRLVADASLVGQLYVLGACVLAARGDPSALSRLADGLGMEGWSPAAIQEGLPYVGCTLATLGHRDAAGDVLSLAAGLGPTGFSRQIYEEGVAEVGAKDSVRSDDPLGETRRIVRSLVETVNRERDGGLT